LYEYDPGSWGPAEADNVMDGRGWHNPVAAAKAPLGQVKSAG
jgi:hypothetical protein